MAVLNSYTYQSKNFYTYLLSKVKTLILTTGRWYFKLCFIEFWNKIISHLNISCNQTLIVTETVFQKLQILFKTQPKKLTLFISVVVLNSKVFLFYLNISNLNQYTLYVYFTALMLNQFNTSLNNIFTSSQFIEQHFQSNSCFQQHFPLNIVATISLYTILPFQESNKSNPFTYATYLPFQEYS